MVLSNARCEGVYSEKLSLLDFFVSLYPIKPESQITHKNLKTIIQKLSCMVKISIDAIDGFLSGDFYLFDAHAGDTACQIRAIRSFNILRLPGLIYELHKSKISLKRILTYFSLPILNDKVDVFSKFISFIKNVSEISKEVVYLSHCYFLNRYSIKDQFGYPYAIDLQLMEQELQLCKKPLKRLVHFVQANLSETSVLFIVNLAKKYSPTIDIQKAVYHGKRTLASGHTILPTFLSMSIVNQYVLKENVDVIVKVYLKNQEVWRILFFKNINGEFSCVRSQNSENNSSPFYVITGVSNAINLNVKKIIDSMQRLFLLNLNAAAHSQYVDGKSWRPNGDVLCEYLKYSKLARLVGCCKENDTFFLATHIHLDTVKNVLNSIQPAQKSNFKTSV